MFITGLAIGGTMGIGIMCIFFLNKTESIELFEDQEE